jgi:hypothetical protein
MLETSDQDNFDAARSEISSVEKFVSLAIQNAPTPEQKEEMKQGCRVRRFRVCGFRVIFAATLFVFATTRR